MQKNTTQQLDKLASSIQGTLHYDSLLRTLYATDASVYRELPLAVAFPKGNEDIKKLIQFAQAHQTSLIPRTAGTSLAGQCVGEGIVVDVSKHFTKILEFNKKENWVRVQPGVVRDELNAFLKPHSYFFSPITSTANRAMIGGMVGNNSCGTTSIQYGSTREHTLELHTILSDGSEAVFKDLTEVEFQKKLQQKNLEGQLYRHIHEELSRTETQENIKNEFPKSSIHRRNTGYAVDYLLDSQVFSASDKLFNFCKLLCGSEGTLAFTTEIKLHVDPLPDPYEVVVAPHFTTIRESMLATQLAMIHQPAKCELMDKVILDCTKDNIEQRKNRYFIEGDPAGVLLIEFRGKTPEEAAQKANVLIDDLQAKKSGYTYPKIFPPNTIGVWSLRSAGLGLLANIPGDKKAVACIEDTAVALEDLAEYIDEFAEVMAGFNQKSVYYAHAGAGEIHLRPILDLKTTEGVEDFYKISEASAKLVKKYRGSLSGEHGDGRVRAAFIPLMVGKENYALFQRIKAIWDSDYIFNPGKIVDAAPMNTSLRYEPEQPTIEPETILDFSSAGGLLRMAEKCNGSGDCRKLPISGGVMCPSYQATRNERDTTRARANILREFLTRGNSTNFQNGSNLKSEDIIQENGSNFGNPTDSAQRFDHQEIKEVMDLCISCKGCTSECPSNVDMASMKAEFLYQYQQVHGIPLRSKAFARINDLNALGAIIPGLTNFFLSNKTTSNILKKILNVAPQRTLPKLQKHSFRSWFNRSRFARFPKSGKSRPIDKSQLKNLYLFCDEFTNHNDTHIGVKAVELLTQLGYEVKLIDHPESGRAAISKGLLQHAKKCAQRNVDIFKNLVTKDTPLVGIEPSAILSFRDEYPRLVRKVDVAAAQQLAKNAFTIEEFIAQEFQAGRIKSEQFTNTNKQLLVHGHCHQKALSNVSYTAWMLSIPANYEVEIIPSGCCGMAGSFGYEAEHYEVSMQMGELVLFPAVRKATEKVQIVAAGTSCRHQISDGVGRTALHPIEVLHAALN